MIKNVNENEYSIYQNQKEIKNFRENYQKFQVYNSFNQIQTNVIVGLDELANHIVEPENIQKKCLHFIIFNTFFDGFKDEKHAGHPTSVALDLDAHSKSQEEEFLRDRNKDNYDDALDELLELLKQDPCCYYCDRSQGGRGIHALFNVISKYVGDNLTLYYPHGDNLLPKLIMERNFEILCKYLKDRYNLNYNNNPKIDYIDDKMKGIRQGFYSSRGKNLHINPDASIIHYKLNVDALIDKIETQYTSSSSLDVETVKTANNQFAKSLFNYGNTLSDTNQSELIEKIGEHFAHYNIKLLFSIKHTDTENKKVFYKLYCKLYRGESLKEYLTSFERFDKYLRSLKEKFIRPLPSIFNNVILFERDSRLVDFWGTPYTHVINYNTYLGEKKDELFEIFNSNHDVVLKAETGGGKSRLSFDYVTYCFNKLDYMNIGYCSPKTSLLNQQKHIIQTDYPNINLIENFGIGKRYKPTKQIKENVTYSNPSSENQTVSKYTNLFNGDTISQTDIENEIHTDYINTSTNPDSFYDLSDDKSALNPSNLQTQTLNESRKLYLSSSPKLGLVPNPDLMMYDETHQLVNYSNKIVSNRSFNCKSIRISATPEPDLIYNSGYTYINMVKNGYKKKELNIVIAKNHLKILKMFVKKEEKTLIFLNHLDKSKRYAKVLEDELSIKFYFLNSKNKDEDENSDAINSQRLKYTHYFCTSYVSEGINFLDIKWDKIIILESGNLTPFEVYQISGRFRLANPEIYLVAKKRLLRYSNFNFRIENFTDMDAYNRRVGELTIQLDALNQDRTTNKNKSFTESDFFMEDIHYNLVLNLDSIKREVFMDAFMDEYMCFTDVFEQSLSYYFTLVKIFLLKKEETDKLEINSDLNILFRKHHKIIYEAINLDADLAKTNITSKMEFDLSDVNPDDIQVNNNPYDLKIDDDVRGLLLDNLSYFQKLVKRCNQIIEKGYEYTEYLDKVTDLEQTFCKFIINLNRKKVGSIKDINHVGVLDKGLWKSQELMHDIIMKSTICMFEVKKGIKYFKTVDLLNHITTNKLYDGFKNEKVNGHFFALTAIKLAEFVGDIDRYFEYKKVNINGSKTGIFIVKKA